MGSLPAGGLDDRGGVRRTTAALADGRTIVYYDERPDAPSRQAVDPRPLAPLEVHAEIRRDPLLDAWVVVAGDRQHRTYHPSPEDCPLCPSRPGHPTEIPASGYDVVVFENRFPALAAAATGDRHDGLLAARPAAGRCEVMCFTDDHHASFGDLTPARVATVVAAWTDRTRELHAHPEVVQVHCFENRGPEIGVTLDHPHGQIYAYPYVTPRTERVLAAAARYHRRTGGNLFDDNLDAEAADGRRVVAANDDWLAFVPFAARWPYEVHLYPRRRVADLTELDGAARATFPPIYLDLLRRFDDLFGAPIPYISGWHQAPSVTGREGFALHLELFSVRRSADRLKHLASTESGMDAFSNDVAPEAAAARLREVAADPAAPGAHR